MVGTGRHGLCESEVSVMPRVRLVSADDQKVYQLDGVGIPLSLHQVDVLVALAALRGYLPTSRMPAAGAHTGACAVAVFPGDHGESNQALNEPDGPDAA